MCHLLFDLDVNLVPVGDGWAIEKSHIHMKPEEPRQVVVLLPAVGISNCIFWPCEAEWVVVVTRRDRCTVPNSAEHVTYVWSIDDIERHVTRMGSAINWFMLYRFIATVHWVFCVNKSIFQISWENNILNILKINFFWAHGNCTHHECESVILIRSPK